VVISGTLYNSILYKQFAVSVSKVGHHDTDIDTESTSQGTPYNDVVVTSILTLTYLTYIYITKRS